MLQIAVDVLTAIAIAFDILAIGGCLSVFGVIVWDLLKR